MIKHCTAICCCMYLLAANAYNSKAQAIHQPVHIIHPVSLKDVTINDPFWSPKYKTWDSVTVYDVFDKLEGKYEPDREDIIKEKQAMGRTRNAFLNFDLVAQGKKNINTHDGPPWYDGLVYETIRGAADLLIQHPDANLEQKIDGYIDRIAAAQAADPDGYLNTYTTLTRPDKRWGTNGGDDKWQHDIYNSGMLVEAAVHYYNATGKTKLLNIAVKLSNYMYTQMGPAPKMNVIPGHAVRATLLATGVTDMALENKEPKYIATANNYWNNMIGKRLFITGGQGAIADGERFGPDYYLPESAYLETCASIGAGFFIQKMNELEGDGKYMGEFERIIYNNLLSGVALNGDHYFYENPLVANAHQRWAWHSCPCCPPMILKMVAALPQYIYAYDSNAVYVNLFIGSNATVPVSGSKVMVKQTTQYPWKGTTKIEVDPAAAEAFTVYVRIPGWAQGKENPFDLYCSKTSTVSTPVTLTVNGKSVTVQPVRGYAAIQRTWKKGDVVELNLPIQPRIISPSDSVQTIKGKLAIAAGPVVYGLEGIDNPQLKNYTINTNTPLTLTYKPGLLNGVNVITGTASDGSNNNVTFTAIPFYSIGNRGTISPYQVWLQEKK